MFNIGLWLLLLLCASACSAFAFGGRKAILAAFLLIPGAAVAGLLSGHGAWIATVLFLLGMTMLVAAALSTGVAALLQVRLDGTMPGAAFALLAAGTAGLLSEGFSGRFEPPAQARFALLESRNVQDDRF
jgi:hypothetical protein